MDDLIAEHAAKLQEIYDNRTAGGHTFTGVLATFLHEICHSIDAVESITEHHERYQTH